MITEKLFSYGTLYKKSVQLELFGRELIGKPDRLTGFQLSHIAINNQDVVNTSGEAVHPIANYTANQQEHISGHVFDVSMDEILQADRYEVAEYKRVSVTLYSGTKAWVYIDTNDVTQYNNSLTLCE